MALPLGRGTASADRCVTDFTANLRQCRPFHCRSTDPRLQGREVRLQIEGRQAGLCQATGAADKTVMTCRLSRRSVYYLNQKSTLRDLQSPDLQASLRAPNSPEEALLLLHGHPLVAVSVKGRSLETDFVSRECTLSSF